MADFKARLNEAAEHSQTAIASALKDIEGPIPQAMLYAAKGGKAMRAFLALESARLHGIENAVPAAAAIECIHAYSLIHDDLPCMDDDAMRRGQPTVHIKWNEAIAVLAGDGLQALAFELLADADWHLDQRWILSRTLAKASGISGMVGGQGMDIAAETADEPLTLQQTISLQQKKTGALISWASLVGPRMSGEPHESLDTYGQCIGLAFQIADDVLDVEGDAEAVGKAVGKDEAAGKATFVSLLGQDGAKRRADSLVQEACDALSIYGSAADTLRQAARFVVNRTH